MTTARRETLIGVALPLALLVAIAVAWEVGASLGHNLLIATFSETMAAAFRLLFAVEGDLWPALLESNKAMVLGYAIAVAIAIPVGLAAGFFKRFDRVLSPHWAILLAVPMAPIIPVLMTALGLTLTARVTLVVLFVAVYLMVNTRAGVRSVDPSLTEMARSYGASRADLWRLVVLPAAAPAIFAGLRIGIGRAVSGMILAELLLVAVGIGRLMLLFRGRFQPDLLFAVVLIVVLEALILLRVMTYLERRLAPWSA